MTKENPILLAAQSERQKDMEMLLNRWNKNKQMGNDNSAGIKQNATAGSQVSFHRGFISNLKDLMLCISIL